MGWRWVGLAAVVAAGAAGAYLAWPSSQPTPKADALWHIVHDQCVPAAASGGAPCRLVDADGRYAVLKDHKGATQFLVIPTDRVTGIESPALVDPAAPNYWQDAWSARRFFVEAAGRDAARDEIGLAVNSPHGRSQNQLHIHIDCVRADVRAALAAADGTITADWKTLAAPLAGHRYRARRLDGAEIAPAEPFRLLAASLEPGATMADMTLAVIGHRFADGTDGFVLLADRADMLAGDAGASESLLDHNCAVLRDPS